MPDCWALPGRRQTGFARRPGVGLRFRQGSGFRVKVLVAFSIQVLGSGFRV